MDQLQSIRIFVRVAECGSFSAVARELDISQSAVSKHVAALEHTLGARLLVRTTRSLSLTGEGQQYFEQVQRILADLDAASSQLKTGQQQLAGKIRVAASNAFGRLVLMPLLHEFLLLHPQVQIDLKMDDGFIDLAEHGVDVAIRVGNLPDSSLVARQIGQSQRIVVAHRNYLERQPASVLLPCCPQDLLQHNCIVYTSLAEKNAWEFMQNTKEPPAVPVRQTVLVRGNFQANSSEIMRAAVLAGTGIGYSPEWLFTEEIRQGEVIWLLQDWVAPPVPVTVVTPAGRSHSARVSALVEHIRTGASRLAG